MYNNINILLTYYLKKGVLRQIFLQLKSLSKYDNDKQNNYTYLIRLNIRVFI